MYIFNNVFFINLVIFFALTLLANKAARRKYLCNQCDKTRVFLKRKESKISRNEGQECVRRQDLED